MEPKVLEFTRNPPGTIEMETTQETIDTGSERISSEPHGDFRDSHFTDACRG